MYVPCMPLTVSSCSCVKAQEVAEVECCACFVELADEGFHVRHGQVDVTAECVQLAHRYLTASSQLAALLKSRQEALGLTLQIITHWSNPAGRAKRLALAAGSTERDGLCPAAGGGDPYVQAPHKGRSQAQESCTSASHHASNAYAYPLELNCARLHMPACCLSGFLWL